MINFFLYRASLFILLFLVGCASNETIVNNVEEREANEIVVFLASKGIPAQKVAAVSTSPGATSASGMFNIAVAKDKITNAMAVLNRYGLPRPKGTSLLQLFAPQGLMSSSKEETIRYQAGLAEELRNTIRKMDGVIDANVQISFPDASNVSVPGEKAPIVTAAVFVKHQGIFEDPNSYMEVKIKRLLAGSILGLEFDNVSVISDRSRFTDIELHTEPEAIGVKALQQTHVSLWGLVMTQDSLSRFRTIFFTFILLILAFASVVGWLIYKFYPQMRPRKEKILSSESNEASEPEV